MTKNPNKDSFATAAKRSSKIVRPDSGIVPPNTRSRAKNTSTSNQSSVPTQIETNKNDDASRISNKTTTSSKLEAHYRELLRQEKQKFAAKMKSLQKEKSDLAHTNQKLSEEISDLEKELDDQKGTKSTQHAKFVKENKNKNKKHNKNSFAVLEDPDDEVSFEQGDIEDENRSYPSVTQTNKTEPKSTSKKFTTPGAEQIPLSTPLPAAESQTPFQVFDSTPSLPQGHTWSQFRDSSGDILWRAIPTPAPSSSGQSYQGNFSSSTSTPVDLTQNPNFQQGFTAPPGCLQFHRPTWTKEIKHIACNSDDLNGIKTWYADLRSCLLSSSQGTEVLPPIENLTSSYDFKATLLPPPHQSNYVRAKKDFDGLTSALRLYLTKKTTFENCPSTVLALDLHRSEDCGLDLLLKILSQVFPHLGAGYIDFVTEVTKLTLTKEIF